MELKVLIDEVSLKKKVKEISEKISSDYSGIPLTVICVLKGAFIFTADIVRELKTETTIDFIRVKSYEGKAKLESRITYKPEIDLREKHVLIIDDIFDTGESLETVYKYIQSQKPASIKSCVLLSKDVPKRTNLQVDYIGFNVPNKFIVGYGLDVNELYRDLPYIGYIEE